MTLPDEAERTLLSRYRREIDQLVSAGGKVTLQAFRRIGSLDEAAIARFIDEAGPALRDVSARAGASASGVAAMLTDSPVGVPGVADPAWRDPFTSGWRALGNGAEFDDAFEQAASVADATGRNAVASTAREAVGASAPAGTKWRRITDADPCEWCVMVARKEYNSAESANFGHDRCACMVVPAASAANAPGGTPVVDELVGPGGKPVQLSTLNHQTGQYEAGGWTDPKLVDEVQGGLDRIAERYPDAPPLRTVAMDPEQRALGTKSNDVISVSSDFHDPDFWDIRKGESWAFAARDDIGPSATIVHEYGHVMHGELLKRNVHLYDEMDRYLDEVVSYNVAGKPVSAPRWQAGNGSAPSVYALESRYEYVAEAITDAVFHGSKAKDTSLAIDAIMRQGFSR